MKSASVVTKALQVRSGPPRPGGVIAPSVFSILEKLSTLRLLQRAQDFRFVRRDRRR